ncbi:MAG: hypothetical protein Q7T48_00035 [Cellvibrio sp.]|uniref:hypothetical protein n=1 Tax=Cellvibrio sp. TaxID=1965322 RepID=UPI00271AEC0F|nr:hypothetical protein [Cellvibrio sp.]
MQNMLIPEIEHGINSRIYSSDKLAVFFIFLYWILFEHVIFFNASEVGQSMVALTVALKLLIPIGLLAYSGVQLTPIKNKYAGYYLVIFVTFLGWIGLVTLFNGDLIEWFKLLPRFIFFIAVLSIFYKTPAAFYLFAKLLISYVIFALLQYVLTYATGAYDNPVLVTSYMSAGVTGLYANITSMMYFPSFSVPIVRLCGFWNEPSNASGTAFAAFFLSSLVFKKEGGATWKFASYACLTAGFLCFSTVGLLAFGLALLVGFILGNKECNNPIKSAFKLPIMVVAVGGVGAAIFGRAYVAENYADNDILRVIVGLRDTSQTEDVYSGRLVVIENTINHVAEHIFGTGLSAIDLSNNVMMSASAPMYWLLIGGILGLVLLLLRELMLVAACYKLAKSSPEHVYLVQALVAIMAQHLSYGSWMNPNYFILVAAIMSFIAYENRTWIPLPQ